ncbi:uncharacterized protein ARMOST_12076 [Armillaria ostoyae]|uniref:Protein kinase domain-containing protein n=1 Tax=Armillaria ostoyae TaxID=47428 RepID=A0A284RJ23_ARMOS|nr:uncharacterized protein ARMOST_12076 [Armillaria ostoyae]
MDQPLPTWRDFLDIRFEHHLCLDEISSTHNIHQYPAIAPPPAEKSLCQSDPDPTIVPRILHSFRSYLDDKGWLDRPLPSNLVTLLELFQQDLLTTTLSNKSTVEFLRGYMFPVIHVAVKALSSTPDQTFAVKRCAPERQYAQQGDIDWITVTFPTKTPVKSIGVEAKRPRLLFHNAKDMQNEREYGTLDPQYDAKAAWLQLSTSDPASDHRVIFSGLSTIIIEKNVYASNHHGLLVSPHYHLFRDDNPPTPAEYPFIDEWNRCEKGIPLFAVMTYLMLPNTSVRKGVLPTIRNPITPREKATQSDSRGLRETPNTRDGTAISLKFDHPDVTGLPRLLYAQVLHDDLLDDTPPLASSSICSASSNVQLFQRINIGNFAQVWRGSLTDSNETVVSVVAKIFFRHQLEDLAPMYYGTFTMPDESWGAVILSDVGEAFHCYSWDEAGMSAEELRTIWKHVNGLHSVGLHHHDLEPRNVAKDGNGTLRILDYELSSLDKSCSCGELERLGQVFDSLMEWR